MKWKDFQGWYFHFPLFLSDFAFVFISLIWKHPAVYYMQNKQTKK